jgi:hypothetical protein
MMSESIVLVDMINLKETGITDKEILDAVK